MRGSYAFTPDLSLQLYTQLFRAEDDLSPLAPWGPSPYGRSLGRRIGDPFDIFPADVFLIKLSYALLN